MSLLSSIAGGIAKVAGAASFIPGVNAIAAPIALAAGTIAKLAPTTKVPTPVAPISMPPAQLFPANVPMVTTYAQPPGYAMAPASGVTANASVGDVIRGAIGGAAGAIGGGIVQQFLPGLSPGQTGSSCGCKGSGRHRDPCTHQVIGSKNNPAPLATFFGGCCPPGRVLRRKPMGRDVCIKQPRMNPFNPRALARADHRITTFARRTAPILKSMGFTVTSTRHVHVKGVKRKASKRG